MPAPRSVLDWLVRSATGVVVQLPGGARALHQLEAVERAVLSGLRERLDQLGPGPSTSRPAPPPRRADGRSPARAFAELLERAERQSPAEARLEAATRIVGQLVPDEARIIATLADGSSHPVVHVTIGSTLGGPNERAVSNVSSIGRAAKVRSHDLIPTYIAHLVDLGLAELGPEAEADAVEYEILEADTAVRRAVERAEHKRMLRARVVRQTIRLSEQGQALWSLCAPVDQPAHELPADMQ